MGKNGFVDAARLRKVQALLRIVPPARNDREAGHIVSWLRAFSEADRRVFAQRAGVNGSRRSKRRCVRRATGSSVRSSRGIATRRSRRRCEMVRRASRVVALELVASERVLPGRDRDRAQHPGAAVARTGAAHGEPLRSAVGNRETSPR